MAKVPRLDLDKMASLASMSIEDLDSSEKVLAKQLCDLTKEVFRNHEKEAVTMMALGDIYKQRCLRKSAEREHYTKAIGLYTGAKTCLNKATEAGKKFDQYSDQITTSCEEVKQLYRKHIIKRGPNMVKQWSAAGELKTYRDKLKIKVEDELVRLFYECPKPEFGKNPEYEKRLNKQIRSICEENTKFVKEFTAKMMSDSVAECGPPPYRFTMVGLGSLARGETTPYSDLEYILLTDEDDIHDEYFLNLHYHFQMQVLSLGETPLPTIAIKSLNDFYNPDDSNNFYDDVSVSGFKLDGNMPWASKTPPGHKGTRKRKPLKLIGTPKYMAKLSTTEADKNNGYHLATIISTATRIMGDEKLFQEFKQQLARVRADENQDSILKACIKRMKADCKKYKCVINDDSLRSRNAKQDYYRFPSTLISNLKDLYGIDKTSPWEIIDELQDKIHVGGETCSDLAFMINTVIGIRMYTYCTKNQQHELIQVNQDLFPDNSIQDVVPSIRTSNISREKLPIPFTNFLQHYFLRYMSASISVPAQLEKPLTLSSSGAPELMQTCPMYCMCKLCLLHVKLLTCVGPDDTIDNPSVVLESVKRSWHYKIQPVTRKTVFNVVEYCHYLRGDHSSRLKLFQAEVQSEDMTSDVKAVYLCRIAQCHYRLKDYSAALSSVEESIKLTPHSELLRPMIVKIWILHDMNEYTQLRSCCETCINIQSQCEPRINTNTDKLEIHYYYSATLIHFKEYEAALESLIKAKPLCSEVLGESHWMYKGILQRMLTCYTALGRETEAGKIKSMITKCK
ncbi:unnamed protein product [Owenia fusiformis]|uniref:Uncharacterized protein n=1 Tax=Owenia fusiformis TaxID=6347 RepID=A0A8J1Y1Y7_OWEFU|nr:unnamed protein product [Owenia fusiformis]